MFKKFTALALAGFLFGCAGLTAAATFIVSPQGQAFLNAIGAGGSLVPGVNAVVAAVDAGLSVTKSDVAIMCYAVPWAQGALTFIEPDLHFPATVIQDEAAAYSGVMAYCQSPPSDIPSAVEALARMYLSITNTLSTGGVPVTVPVTARIHVMPMQQMVH
jgi:hypothetical protein